MSPLNAFLATCTTHGLTPREEFPGFVVVPDFGTKVLGLDVNQLVQQLDCNLPARGSEDAIDPGKSQWVLGANKDLKYRGHELKRRKIWAQDGPVEDGVRIYNYTGFTYPVAQATSDWNDVKVLANASRKMNEILAEAEGPRMNHLIVTAYNDGSHNIGFHSDKVKSLEPDSWIAVVKLGPAERRFAVRARAKEGEDQEKTEVLFNEMVSPGTLLLMNWSANLNTQHGVPVMESEPVGLSGSIVWRSVKTLLSQQELQRKIAATQKGRMARAAKKRAREE